MLLELETIEGGVHQVECDGAVWDADGTVYEGYENGPVETARAQALRSLGLVVPPSERLRGFTGEEAKTIIRKFQTRQVQAGWDALWPQIIEAFVEALHQPFTITLLEDASQLAKDLAEVGLPHAVATNSSRNNWEEKRARVPDLASTHFLDTVVTMTCAGSPKPSPAMLHKAGKRIGAEKPVLFGDSKPDAMAAKNAGWPCIVRADGRTSDQLQYIQGYGAWVVPDFSHVKIVR